MGSSREDFPTGDDLSIERLCAQYLSLDGRRAELDQQISVWSGCTSIQGALWQELDAIVAKLTALGEELAAVPAVGAVGLRAKAEVLVDLLQSRADDSGSCYREVLALALSVAGDVMRLV